MKIALLATCLLMFLSQFAQGDDAFDRHTAYWLKQATRDAKPLKEVSMDQAARLRSIGDNIDGACVVVKTDKDNWAKALISWGFVKGPDRPIPVLLIDRFVTYRGDRNNVTTAVGKKVILFAGFGFDFDLGQVVPAGLGDDVNFSKKAALRPREKSELYALDGSQLPAEEKTDKYDPNDHAGVRARDFEGMWVVDVDGRWRGQWQLSVGEGGRVQGTLTSADSKSTYPITGRVSLPPHRIRLVIHLDNAEQTIDGYLWTKDKSAIAGTATLASRKFGFHAKRVTANKKPAQK
ncbi:MAG: hypothetical protein HON53_14920 [Planctomycetaceae bacterium]|jgi:hypothetical protein|nr:hypothetical protein [Planctomycetaceae bacterium]MBT6154223.1 hypothetical protein [Planctomycetaceae bacterium]MBT6485679.1 hypothetical protein [Planctomycetaceae bacterium]MBT6497712.1 hypothetical protein [Planctomycetaceae bacterium]